MPPNRAWQIRAGRIPDDSIFHADGQLAEGSIALAEVQGYVYAAKHLAASLRALRLRQQGSRTRHGAEQLRRPPSRSILVRGIGTYALRAGRRQAALPVRSSNAGQVLFAGIAAPRPGPVVADLMLPEIFSGWGIRTLSARCALQSDVLSQWLGLAARQRADRAGPGALRPEARASSDLRRPVRRRDLYGADAACPNCSAASAPSAARPDPYPVACAPQAWASVMPFALLQAALGLEFDAARSEIRLRNRRTCRRSSTRWCCAICNSVLPASILGSAAMARTYRWKCCAHAAGFRCRSCWRTELPDVRRL